MVDLLLDRPDGAPAPPASILRPPKPPVSLPPGLAQPSHGTSAPHQQAQSAAFPPGLAMVPPPGIGQVRFADSLPAPRASSDGTRAPPVKPLVAPLASVEPALPPGIRGGNGPRSPAVPSPGRKPPQLTQSGPLSSPPGIKQPKLPAARLAPIASAACTRQSAADAEAGSDFVRERMPLQDLKNALKLVGRSSDGPRDELAARWLDAAQEDLVIPFYHGHQGPWRQLSNWFVSDKWAFFPPVWDTASGTLNFSRANVLPILVSSSEEAIMLCKARVMEDTFSFDVMMTVVNGNSDGTGAHGPRATKAIGRNVKPWIDARWTKCRPQVALAVLTQKFSSHPDMSDLLLATGRASLAEAADPRFTPDKIWGTGIVAEAILRGEQWPAGRNLQGHSLQLVRAHLRQQLTQQEAAQGTSRGTDGPSRGAGGIPHSVSPPSGGAAAGTAAGPNRTGGQRAPSRAASGAVPEVVAMGIEVDESGIPSTDSDFFRPPREWASMLHGAPEEALLLTAALSDLPEVWDSVTAPIKFARMSYRANPKSIVANAAAGARLIGEAQRLIATSADSVEFLHLFPEYVQRLLATAVHHRAESEVTGRLRELSALILQEHFHLMRAFLTWLPLNHEDEIPARLERQPAAFAAELVHAASTSNAMMAADPSDLESEMYDVQNVCLPRAVQPDRVFADTGFRPRDPVSGLWLPHLLYRPEGFTFTKAHGDYVTRCIIPGEHSTSSESVHLSPERIWFWECEWLRTHAALLSAATSPAHGGTRVHPGPVRRPPSRIPNIFVIPPEARDPRAGDAVYDLRAWNDNNSAPILPIQQGDERRVGGLGSAEFAAGIRSLQQEFHPPDLDTAEQMASAIYTGAMDGGFRGSVYASNYAGYYEHADHAVAATAAEVTSGIIQGNASLVGTHAPHFNPQKSFACGVAIQPGSGKKRIIGDGGCPRASSSFPGTLDGVPLSNNDSQDTSDPIAFPALKLPTVMSFCRNFAIGQSCSDYCTVQSRAWRLSSLERAEIISVAKRLDMQALLTDWVAFYRSFVVSIYYLWTQGNVRLPSGLTTDTGMYFGDRHAPFPSNLCMTWLLFILCELFYLRLTKVTTWCVSSQTETGAAYTGPDPPPLHPSPGTFDHMDAHPGTSGSSSFQALHRAAGWDSSEPVRTWRQNRYKKAREKGMSDRDAFWQSIPFARQGFYDDGSFSVASCLMWLLIESLLELVIRVGVGLAYTKLVIGFRDDTIAAVSIAERCQREQRLPRVYADLHVVIGPGSPVVLGKLTVLSSMIAKDTPARITTVVSAMMAVIAGKGPRHLASIKAIRSIIGVLIFMVMTQPDLRGIMNAPIRCLKAPLTTLRDKDATAFPQAAEDAFRTLCYAVQHAPGRPFAANLVLPNFGDCIFLMHDAAGLSDDEPESYRGGGSWIWIPRTQKVLWTTRPFSQDLLTSEHSTSLELLNGNVTLAYALSQWRNTTIVEIFDNQAASCSARRLACHSDSLNTHMAYRRTLLAKYPRSRVFSIWAQRELGTLADMLSKSQIDQFWHALEQRGFPEPAQQMFPRPVWYI
jgi:ribA/ribD-fused uncharacterized protein